MNLFRNVSFFLILSLFFSCYVANNKKVNSLSNQLKTITIQTQSRGFNQTLSFHKYKLEKLNFDEKIDSKSIDDKQWQEAVVLVEKLNLEKLNSLKVPTVLHQSDGKKAEVLTIRVGDEEYQSPTYDEGNPPSEIKDIVNYVKNLDGKK